MQKSNSVIIFLSVFLVCCNAPVKKQENTNSNMVSTTTITDMSQPDAKHIDQILTDTITDMLPSNIQRINLEIIKNSISFDTLKIVSVNHDLLWNPFGVHSNMQSFLSSLPEDVVVEKQIKTGGIEIHSIHIGNSLIKVFVAEDLYAGNIMVNTVYAEIEVDAIEIANCIRVGMTKQLFIETFGLENMDSLNEINVVELISGLLGVWQYYTFNNNNILTRIEIKTDYIFQ